LSARFTAPLPPTCGFSHFYPRVLALFLGIFSGLPPHFVRFSGRAFHSLGLALFIPPFPFFEEDCELFVKDRFPVLSFPFVSSSFSKDG